jgi:DNA-binding GntR family transcriptional regulator
MILQMTEPKTLGRISTVQAVADDVRARVLDGEFEPGAQLRETDLVDHYAVARHCVRSALHQLSHEGLLRHHQNRGVFVPDADPDAIVDVLVARAAIETEALRLVVEDDRPVAGVVDAMERLEALPEDAPWSELLQRDHDVHRAIVTASGSQRLRQFHEGLLAESQLLLAFVRDKDEQRTTIRPNHRELIKALIGGELERATELLRRDLGESIPGTSL